MATVSAQGTTFNLPNYHGELFVITPTETPFLSAIGGLGGAKMTSARVFEWQTVDRRASSANNVALEGAAAPTAQERSRSNIDNVTEIHHSAINISYTRLAAVGQFAGANIAAQSDDSIINELTFQTSAELESMAVDIEQSFLTGTYANPATNASPRQTQGILGAIATGPNVYDNGTPYGSATIAAATGIFTTSTQSPALTAGQRVTLGPITTTTGVSEGVNYYVLGASLSTTTFTLSATPDGTALTLTGNGSTTGVYAAGATAKATIDGALALAYENGAKLPDATTVLMMGPQAKVNLSNAYALPALNWPTQSRTIGGVAMQTLVTDFGTFGVMVNRWMPVGTIAVIDLSVCYPVFLNIPDKGLLFAEELARTGSNRQFQLYGEIGLEYGPPTYHALISGLL
jgi:hypothetical protein